MNCLAKPTQQTGEPEAPARASVPERFRRLKRNEVVWSGDFVADERLGFELWEAPGVFRAGSFARPIYQKEETERFRPTSTRKPKQKITAYLKPNCGWSKGVRAIFGKSQSALRRSRYHQQSVASLRRETNRQACFISPSAERPIVRRFDTRGKTRAASGRRRRSGAMR